MHKWFTVPCRVSRKDPDSGRRYEETVVVRVHRRNAENAIRQAVKRTGGKPIIGMVTRP
jgi:hypothetical protein